MQFPVPHQRAGIPTAPRAVAAGRANSRQLHLHGALPEVCGTLCLAIARAAASADGTGSHALACARLHGSRRAARAAHTGTRMHLAMAHSYRRCCTGVALTPFQQGRMAPWP